MVVRQSISVVIFIVLCFSFSSFAEEKVYTNKDLERAPSLDRDSKIDPATGKVINQKDVSSKATKPETILTRAKHTAAVFSHEVKTNKRVQAVITGILLLIWVAFVIDVVRFEFRGNNKLIWFIAVTFIPVAGWILYFFIGTRQKKYKIIRDYE
jgi:hypothetical protein